LNLPPRCHRNRSIRRPAGQALKRVSNTGQLERNLVGSARPLQQNDSFSAEVKGGPEQHTNHKGYDSHEDVVTCNRKASTRDSNDVVREQSLLPAGPCDC
jgi:hypothetical protein